MVADTVMLCDVAENVVLVTEPLLNFSVSVIPEVAEHTLKYYFPCLLTDLGVYTQLCHFRHLSCQDTFHVPDYTRRSVRFLASRQAE